MAKTDKNASRKGGYLDLLCQEELWNIVRHMSCYPRRPNWAFFVSSKDVKNLCRGSGYLFDMFRERLKILCVAESRIAVSGMGSKKSSAPKFFVKLEDLSNFLTMESIVLHGLCMRFYNDSANMALGPLLRHGKGLRSISLEVPPRTSTESILDLWPAVGESLECLEFEGREELNHAMLEVLQQHCRNLRNIHIRALPIEPEEGEPYRTALKDLYVSYGVQLESISIEYLPEGYVKEIRKACPNVRVRLLCFHPDEIRTMCELGSSVSFLRIYISGMESVQSNVLDIQRGFASFTNLKEVEITSPAEETDEQVLCALSALPKSSLKTLYISCPLDTQNILSMASTGARSLQTLSCDVSTGEICDIPTLIQNNCSLETVNITINVWESSINRDATVTGLVQKFSQCSQLRELTIRIDSGQYERPKYSEDIANLCLGFRCRRTFVEILGKVYLP